MYYFQLNNLKYFSHLNPGNLYYLKNLSYKEYNHFFHLLIFYTFLLKFLSQITRIQGIL